MKKVQFITVFILLISLSNCKKKSLLNIDIEVPNTYGTLKNYTGLGGCGWVIELDVKDKHNNNKVEPTNLKKFNVNLVDGQKVKFSCTEKVGGMSSCMVGTIVELKSIKNN